MKRGQRDALLMFTCAIDPVGQGYGLQTYRESPGAEALKTHLLDRYQRALFIPALLESRPQTAIMFGTVIFSIVNEKPRLVIFLNQEEEDLRLGRAFIAPQVTFAAGRRFKGIFYPPGVKAAGGVIASVDVDIAGNVRGAAVLEELPKGLGFGPQVVGQIRNALFIPGFRDGKAVACRFSMPVVFAGPLASWKTGPRANVLGQSRASRTGYNFPANPKP